MLKFLSSALLTMVTGTLCAYIHPAPGGFAISADYLYLTPSVDDTYFVVKSPIITTYPNGERENNDFEFHSGYRLAGVYAFCGCECPRELIVSYSHLNAAHVETIETETRSERLWATVGDPIFLELFSGFQGSATSKVKAEYDRLDVLYSQQVYNCCDLDCRLLFGFECASLSFQEKYTYLTNTFFLAPSAATGKIHQKSKTWGFGPELGVAASYQLCEFTQCLPGTLSITVASSGSVLASKCKTRAKDKVSGLFITGLEEMISKDIINGTLLDVHDEQTWRVVPAFHARVGLNYDTCICSYDTSLEVGYEFSSYYRGAQRVVYLDDVSRGMCTTNYYNFDVQGVYASFSLAF